MPQCCVPECYNRNKTNPDLSFHRFPKCQTTTRKWLKLIRRERFVPSSNTRICSWHFPSGKDAGPTRFKWNEGKRIDCGSPGKRSQFDTVERCCLPDCDVKLGVGKPTLFHMPTKKFCNPSILDWAEDLEKTIRAFRVDQCLESMYERDSVYVCRRHFQCKDIISEGGRLQLRVGATIRLNLPNQSVETAPSDVDASIKTVGQIIYHQHLYDIKRSASQYMPKSWDFKFNKDHIALYTKADIGSFPKLMMKISNSLDIHAAFHGWFTDKGAALESIDVRKMTLETMLHSLSILKTCAGIPNVESWDFQDDTIIRHYKISHSCDADMTTVPPPPTLDLIAARSKNCEVFLKSGSVCQPCLDLLKKLPYCLENDGNRSSFEHFCVDRKPIVNDSKNMRMAMCNKKSKDAAASTSPSHCSLMCHRSIGVSTKEDKVSADFACQFGRSYLGGNKEYAVVKWITSPTSQFLV